MLNCDYKRNDLLRVKDNKNEKKYYVRVNKSYVEVSIEVFRVIEADYKKNNKDESTRIKIFSRKI